MNLKLRLAAVGDAGALAPVARIARVLDISAHPPTAVVVTIEPPGAAGDALGAVRRKLVSGELDVALCPARHLPLVLPDGVELAAVIRCRDARYRFVSLEHPDLTLLPHGSKLAVCDPVIRAQILHGQPWLRVDLVPAGETIPGGVRSGAWDAACVPAEIVEADPLLAEQACVLPAEEFLPYVGQGLVAVLVAASGSRVRDPLRSIDEPVLRHCLQIERTFLARIAASGTSAVATAHATQDEGHISLTGLVAESSGRWLVSDQARAPARFGEIIALEIADACRKLANGRFAVSLTRSDPADSSRIRPAPGAAPPGSRS